MENEIRPIIKTVVWSNNDVPSIKRAERKKADLESKGYKLINTDIGYYTCVLTYAL